MKAHLTYVVFGVLGRPFLLRGIQGHKHSQPSLEVLPRCGEL